MLARELMSNDASVCWMVNVIFIWAIMPTFWLLAALNSHTPEKSVRGAARAERAVNRKATAENFSLMRLSFRQAQPKSGSWLTSRVWSLYLGIGSRKFFRRALEPISWSGHQASWRPGRSFQVTVPGNVKQTPAEAFWAS